MLEHCFIHSLCFVFVGLVDEQQKVRTITALALAALAEAATPYGIESFDSVLKPLWKGIRQHRGKVHCFVHWSSEMFVPVIIICLCWRRVMALGIRSCGTCTSHYFLVTLTDENLAYRQHDKQQITFVGIWEDPKQAKSKLL